MAERIASGEVWVGVSDAEAIAGLRNVDREFDRTMRKIDGKEAEAHVSVNLRELKRDLKEAEAELAKWRAREEAAESKHQRYYRSQRRKEAEESAKYLRDEVKMQESGLQALKDQNKQRDFGLQREKELDRAMQRRVKDIDKMAMQEAKAAAARERAGLDDLKRQELITRKQREYGRAVREVESAQRRKKGTIIGTEIREKVEIDERFAREKMLRLVEELRLIGGRPPVKIKVDTDRRDVGFVRRRLFQLQSAAAGVAEKLSSIGHVRLNLGPFSGTIRTMTVAVGALAPIISSVVLSLSSLVGVMGAGITGAAAVGAGAVMGLGMGFLGLKFASRNAGQEIANARTAINALQKAQEKYGKGSDQAKKKQAELNNTLKNISPLARETALGIEKFYKTFDKHAGPTRKNLGGIAKDGFAALNKLTPMWAQHTNKLSDILHKNLSKGFEFLSKGEGKQALSQIFANFNRSLPALMRGLGAFGHAFLNFGREGSKFLPDLTKGIEHLGNKLLDFTQRDDFGATIKKWVGYARDLTRFFGAAGRVIMHFFGDGASAGDKFVTDMTAGLNRWDDFLTSTEGKNRLAGMFTEGVKATESLGKALGPILKGFTEWSTAMAPITKGILDGVGAITKFVGMITHVIALKGAFAALGETIVLAFAVSKIAAFVNMLIKAYDLVKAISVAMAAQSGAGFLAQAGAGLGALRAGKGASTLAAEAEAAGAAAGASKVAQAGGAAEKAAGQMAMFEGEAAAAGASGVVAGEGAAAAGVGMGALGAAAVVAIPAVIAVGGAYLIYKHRISEAAKATQNYIDIDNQMNDAIQRQISAESDAAKTHDRYAEATRGVHRAEKDVAKARNEDGKKGTKDLIDSEARLFDQRERQAKQRSKFITDAKQQQAAVRDQISLQKDQIKAHLDTVQALREQAAAEGRTSGTGKASADTLQKLAVATAAWRAELNILRGKQAEATTASLNHQRALQGVEAIAKSSAQRIGFFAQQFGKIPSVKKILLSANTSQLDKIANLSKQVNSSVGRTATKNILVNAKSADDAIKKLKAVQEFALDHKTLTINSPSAGKALVDLAKIEGVKLKPKDVKAALAGDKDVIRKLEIIVGFKLPEKHVNVRAFADQALAAVRRVAQELAALHDKSINVNTYYRYHQVGNPRGGQTPGQRAAGGAIGPEEKMAHAAAYSAASKTTGGKHSRPTFLVGEEHRPEYVIATNPAYRKRNVQYWMQAAKALNIPGYAGGYSPNFNPMESPGNLNTTGTASLGQFGFQPGFEPVAAPKGKAPALTRKRKKAINKKRGRIKLKSQDGPWTSRVKKLLEQQSDVEREVGLRENAQPEEPETFLYDTGRKDANGDPVMAVDDTAVQNYKKSFQPIIDARNALVNIIQELVTSLPNALNELATRKYTAQHNSTKLRASIKLNEGKIKAAMIAKGKVKGKSANATAKRADLQTKIDKLRGIVKRENKELRRQGKIANNAQDDLNTFKDQGKESGFDYRDAVQLRDAAVAEQTGVDKTSADQLAATQPKDTGPGSEPVQELSYGDQAYLADAEKYNALRSYGSNFDVGAGYGANDAGVGAGTIGSGQVTNPALISGPNAINNALSSGGFSSGSAITSALSGGASAARAIASPMTAASAFASDPTAAGATGGPTVNIVNNFETQPADPHTWSQGVAFEMAAAV